MRELTPEESAQIQELETTFEEFYPALMQMAGDFAERLRLPEPHLIVEQPGRFVPAIAAALHEEALDDEDKAWLLPRLAFVIGESVAERFENGAWYVNRDPESPSFARYIVGGDGAENYIDPFTAAATFLDLPPGRDLRGYVESLV
jgi:hypothetical protein